MIVVLVKIYLLTGLVFALGLNLNVIKNVASMAFGKFTLIMEHSMSPVEEKAFTESTSEHHDGCSRFVLVIAILLWFLIKRVITWPREAKAWIYQ